MQMQDTRDFIVCVLYCDRIMIKKKQNCHDSSLYCATICSNVIVNKICDDLILSMFDNKKYNKIEFQINELFTRKYSHHDKIMWYIHFIMTKSNNEVFYFCDFKEFK